MKNLIFSTIALIVAIASLAFTVTGCSVNSYATTDKAKNYSTDCEQPGSFFPDDEQRYILVDRGEQKIGNSTVKLYIYADRYTHVMYEFVFNGAYGAFDVIPLEYEDGSPMLYDNGEW